MKVIIPILSDSLDAIVDERFGRASFFVLADTESGDREVISNPAAVETSGAGVRAARLVLDRGAGAVTSVHLGPKAEEVLRAGGVEIYLLPPGEFTVDRVLELFAAGELTRD